MTVSTLHDRAVAAWVAGEPVRADEVNARLAAIRSAPLGWLLPPITSAEGRNARRWVTQLICAERIVRGALSEQGIAISGRSLPLRTDRALALGGVTAAVLAGIPELGEWVRSWALHNEESAVRDYYERNHDLYADRGVSYDDAHDDIAARLRQASADAALSSWLDERLASDVVLAAGYEHPADPRHADATHRH